MLIISGNRVLIDRLLSHQNSGILLDGLESRKLDVKFKCINALLEAAKFEMYHGILATQEIIDRLVKGLLDLGDYQSAESNSLHALYLLNIDGLCFY